MEVAHLEISTVSIMTEGAAYSAVGEQAAEGEGGVPLARPRAVRVLARVLRRALPDPAARDPRRAVTEAERLARNLALQNALRCA